MQKQWLHLGVTDRFDSYAEWSATDMDERRRRVIAVYIAWPVAPLVATDRLSVHRGGHV